VDHVTAKSNPDLGEGTGRRTVQSESVVSRLYRTADVTWFYCLGVALVLMFATIGSAFAAWKDDDSAYIGLAILFIVPTAATALVALGEPIAADSSK